MANDITIEGLDKCLDWCDNGAPAECFSMTRKAMKKATNEAAKKLRRALPRRWKGTVSGKVVKTGTGELLATVGMFNKHTKQGHQGSTQVDDWFKAYWANYGTLSRRSGEHKFDNPIRNKKRRNNVGQPAQLFFEDAVSGLEADFVRAFSENLEKQG